MSAISQDVQIVLRSQDLASANVQSAVGRINAAWKEHRNVQLAVQRGTVLSNQTFFQSAQVLQRVSSVASTFIHIYNSWNIAQLRVTEAQERFTDAQEKYQVLLRTLGPANEKTIAAFKEMERAQREAASATRDSQIMIALLGINALGAVPRIGKLIQELAKLRIALVGLGFVGGVGAAVVAGLAALAAIRTLERIEAGPTPEYFALREQMLRGTTINIENMTVVSDDPDKWAEKIQERSHRR